MKAVGWRRGSTCADIAPPGFRRDERRPKEKVTLCINRRASRVHGGGVEIPTRITRPRAAAGALCGIREVQSY